MVKCMNKKLNILQNFVFFITICLLIGIRFVHSTLSIGVIVMYCLFLVFIIVHAFDLKKKHPILDDSLYLIAFLMVCILSDVIFIRSIFDTNMITVGFMKHFDDAYQMIFLKSNTWLINMSLVLLLLYRITENIKLPKISIQISLKNKSEK